MGKNYWFRRSLCCTVGLFLQIAREQVRNALGSPIKFTKELIMDKYEIKRVGFVTVLCILFLTGSSVAFGQVTNTQVSVKTANTRSVPSGSKMKFQGVVIDRNADTFTIRDRSRTDYQVLITDNTSIKTHGGFLRGGKKYPVTDILRGLIVEVEGRGDAQGQLVADKIRFNESDMRAAVTSDTRVTL